ncbi:MAG: hypothetical protein K8S27_07095 [Candidatus Omnitrophica bacterium]|nr:hypothetical protein [Candidatus Omnitrophota bacterium]
MQSTSYFLIFLLLVVVIFAVQIVSDSNKFKEIDELGCYMEISKIKDTPQGAHMSFDIHCPCDGPECEVPPKYDWQESDFQFYPQLKIEDVKGRNFIISDGRDPDDFMEARGPLYTIKREDEEVILSIGFPNQKFKILSKIKYDYCTKYNKYVDQSQCVSELIAESKGFFPRGKYAAWVDTQVEGVKLKKLFMVQ